MGLNTEEKKTYLGLMKGKVTLRCKPDSEGAIARTNKEGNVIHEKHYSNVSGWLTKIESKDGKYGKQWCLSINDGQTTYVLQFPYSGGYASSFFKALPNVDFTKEIKFSPYSKTVVGEDGTEKERVTLYLSQDGKNVDWKFTKETPYDLPPMKLVKVKGKDTWDDSDQLEYFENMARITNAELDQLNKDRFFAQAATMAAAPLTPAVEEVDDINPAGANDDLPF